VHSEAGKVRIQTTVVIITLQPLLTQLEAEHLIYPSLSTLPSMSPPKTKVASVQLSQIQQAASMVVAWLAGDVNLMEDSSPASPLVHLRDALLSETADGSSNQEVCLKFAEALRIELERAAAAAPSDWLTITSPVAQTDVWVEVRQTAGREMHSRAFTVGRASECDVQVFGDGSVSRLHAIVVALPGRVLVLDLWSPFGTKVLDTRLGQMEESSSGRSCWRAIAVPYDKRTTLRIGERSNVTLCRQLSHLHLGRPRLAQI